MRVVLAALLLSLVAAPLADAQSSPPPQPPPPPSSLSSPPASGLSAGGFGQPLRPFGGSGALVGLPPPGDPTPQCRIGCAQQRYTCGDDDVCAQSWRQCVQACGPVTP